MKLLLASLVITLAHPMLSMESDCGEALFKQLKIEEQLPPLTLQEALNELLIEAAELNLIKEARFELECGANPNAFGGSLGWSPLMEAIHTQSKPMCSLLLESGADIAIPNKKGAIALNFAAVREDASLCKLIISQATFDCPRPSKKERRNSRDVIFSFLLGLKQACPIMPRKIRFAILNATPFWRQHAMNTACGIHRDHPERIPFLPMCVVQALIKGGIITSQTVIQSIAAHNSSRIMPLLNDASNRTEDKEMLELLDFEKFEEHFGVEMRAHIATRLTK